MTRSIQSPIESTNQADATSLAKPLAPEDVRVGDFVALLCETLEYPSYFWDCDATLLPPEELVRLRLVPRGGGVPLKVLSVCLPFVLVKLADGRKRPLDLRTYGLARLDCAFARKAWKAGKQCLAKKNRSKKKRK